MNEYDFDSEEVIDLSPEEQVAATALGLGSTKRLSKKAYAEFKKKAEDIVAQSSVPSKTAREAAKGIVKGGGQKSAEVSARAFEKALEKGPIKVPSGSVISDLPQVSGKMGEAIEKAKRAAAGVPWQPAEGVINLPAPKSPSFLEKISSLAKKAGPDALEKMGLSKNAIASLFEKAAPVAKIGTKLAGPLGLALDAAAASPVGEESDIPKNPFTGEARQLSRAEIASLSPGTPVDYYPPAGRSEMNPPMASSKYDSLENIIADTTRPPEESDVRALATETQTEEAKRVLSPKARMISAGEPTAAQVAKQTEEAALGKILGQKSEYEDLLARYKDAEERQRLAQLGVSLGQAGERIGSALAMVKPGDQSFYEQQMKLAGEITDEFKEEEAVRREGEKNDPKSETSVSMRNLLKEQGITVPENISAAFIEKQYPQFANILNRREAAKERAELRKERAEERAHELEKETKKTANEFVFSGLKALTSDKVYMTRNKVLRGKALVDEALKNPSGFGDVTSLYSAITALDPDSVVREGEIKLSREGMSLGESIQRQITRIGSNPRLINDRLLKDIKKYVDLIDKQTEETYNLKRDALFQQAENRGITKDVYRAMDPFSLKKERAPQATAEEKVVVEKDGKQFRLPKAQLQRAISQGYKEVK